jgi:NTP pyrophosphatase (non-canonical NTP hydrolase)
MEANKYQDLSAATDLYHKSAADLLGEEDVAPGAVRLMLYALGCASEAGEVASLVKKIVRDENGVVNVAKYELLCKELGDVLWYVAQIASMLGVSLDEVMQKNHDKLAARMAAGTIQGSGDNR